MSKTIVIDSKEQFAQLLSSSRIVVADFYADWCGPCKAIAPVYEQLSNQLSRQNTITFTKVNTDSQKEIASLYSVSALPTFIVFKNSREIKRVRGANMKELDGALKDLAAEASSSDAAGASASTASGDWVGACLARGYIDVTSSVDMQGLDFSNLDSSFGGPKSIFAPSRPSSLDAAGNATTAATEKDWIESDTDEQLMMYIPFQSTLKIHTLQITSRPTDGADDVMRPKTVHLYINKTNVLDFGEAESTEPTQSFALDDSAWDAATATAKLEVRFVKFQKVSSLVVFVADGDGDGEKTRIDRLRIVGETGEARKMGKLEKIGDEQGE